MKLNYKWIETHYNDAFISLLESEGIKIYFNRRTGKPYNIDLDFRELDKIMYILCHLPLHLTSNKYQIQSTCWIYNLGDIDTNTAGEIGLTLNREAITEEALDKFIKTHKEWRNKLKLDET